MPVTTPIKKGEEENYLIGDSIYLKDAFWKNHMIEIPEINNTINDERLGLYLDLRIPYGKDGKDNGIPEHVLVIHNSGTDDGSLHWIELRAEDIQAMKMAGIQWVKNFSQFENRINKELAAIHSAWLRVKLEDNKLPPKRLEEQLDDEAKEIVWKTFMEFNYHMFVCGRYHFKQWELWQDIERIYMSNTKLFGDAKEKHIQLLLRYIAAQLALKIGNVAGD